MGHAHAPSARRRRILLAIASIIAMTGALLTFTTAPSGAAGPPPNTSIFFYAASMGGVTGTLHNGQFTQTANVSVPGFTAAALTRDTLLLYNENTGLAAIATLKAGHLSAFKTVKNLGKYFALAAGSCDSVLLYKSGSGAARVLAMSGGGHPRHTFALQPLERQRKKPGVRPAVGTRQGAQLGGTAVHDRQHARRYGRQCTALLADRLDLVERVVDHRRGSLAPR